MSISRADLAVQAEIRELKYQFEQMQRERTGADIDQMKAAQVRADGVAALFRERVSDPTLDDTPLSYRRKLLTKFQRHSPQFKDARIAAYDEPAVRAAEQVIYADAVEAARNGAAEKPGVLVAERFRDDSGRLCTWYFGDPKAWMSHFEGSGAVGFIRRPPGLPK